MLRTLTVLILGVAATGCATLFNSDTKTVSMGTTPSGAEVWIADVNRGVTPLALDLDNHRPHTVVFKRDGYHDVVCEVRASVGAGWVVLDIVFGLLPVIVDAATGAWKSLDLGACNMNMSPVRAPDEQAEPDPPTSKDRSPGPEAKSGR